MCILECLFYSRAYSASDADTDTPDDNGNLGPLLAAARWMPVAIDPFVTLRDVFVVGIQGRSGQREGMKEYVNKLFTLSINCGKG